LQVNFRDTGFRQESDLFGSALKRPALRRRIQHGRF
jgi:hypothetical protein